MAVVRAARRSSAAARVALDGGKMCRGCKELRPVESFCKRSASVDGLLSWCRDCTLKSGKAGRLAHPTRAADNKRARYAADPEAGRAETRRWRAANPDKAKAIAIRCQRIGSWAGTIVSACCNRTRKLGLPECDLTTEYVLSLFNEQHGLCYWLGIPIVPSIETRDPRRPSLDRIETAKGYVRGNVLLCTTFANMGRSALSAEKFAIFVAELKAQIRTA